MLSLDVGDLRCLGSILRTFVELFARMTLCLNEREDLIEGTTMKIAHKEWIASFNSNNYRC